MIMIKYNGERFILLLTQAFVLLSFLTAWEIFVRIDESRLFFFGSPVKILQKMYFKSVDGSLLVDVLITAFEAFAGFIIGNLIGTLLGIALWASRFVFQVARPFIVALGSAPVFALAPLLIIWFGTGIVSKVAIATLSTLFIALYQSYQGAQEVSREYDLLMRSMKARKFQVFLKVIAPGSLVWVMAAFRLNVGFAILGAFIGEFISSNRGLGHMILVASGLFDISLVLLGVLMLALIALGFNAFLGWSEEPIRRAIVRWL